MLILFIVGFLVVLIGVGYAIDMQVMNVRENTNPMKYDVSESLKNIVHGGSLPDKYRLLDLELFEINHFVEQTTFGDIYLIKSYFTNKDAYTYGKNMWLVTTERVYKQNCDYVIPDEKMNNSQDMKYMNHGRDKKLPYNTVVDGCFTIPTNEKPLYGMIVSQVKYSHVNFFGDRYAMMPFLLNNDTKIESNLEIIEFNELNR